MELHRSILTVAFTQVGLHDWHGGQTVVTNAIRALHDARPAQTRVYILGESSADSEAYAGATGADGVVTYAAPPPWSTDRIRSAVRVRLQSYNPSLESALRNAGVQLLIGESVSWRLGRVATVGWLWDFQHLHLPALFDSAELDRRDRKFRHTMRLADRLLATASVTEDARTFAPEYADKVRVVQPCALIDSAIYERDCRAVVRKHKLPEKFFYVPNQFWIHKNHVLVLQALRLLRERGACPQVVLTGRAEDYRNPHHFTTLMRQADQWRVAEQVHYLGVVDRPDVFDLIRQSICVLNPSLFEGWGYAVDEAAGVGKRILASDIRAHREQSAPACEFFSPSSSEELAEGLDRIWRTSAPGPSIELEQQARARMPERIRALGNTLFEVLSECVA